MAETHEEWIRRIYKPSRFHGEDTIQWRNADLEKHGMDLISIHESVTGRMEKFSGFFNAPCDRPSCVNCDGIGCRARIVNNNIARR